MYTNTPGSNKLLFFRTEWISIIDFLELLSEGERLCQKKNFKNGITLFEISVMLYDERKIIVKILNLFLIANYLVYVYTCLKFPLKTDHKWTRTCKIVKINERRLQPNGQCPLLFARLLQGLRLSQERLRIEWVHRGWDG